MPRKLVVVGRAARHTSGAIPAPDLGPEAAVEWGSGLPGNPSAVPTDMDPPVAVGVRALLMEIRRQSSATVLMTRALQRFALVGGAILLLILAALLAVAAILYAGSDASDHRRDAGDHERAPGP